MLLGFADASDITITDAIGQGPNAVTDRCSLTFDTEYLRREVEHVRKRDRRIVPVGTLHTHPRGRDAPSRQDFKAHLKWVKLLPLKFGIFGIATLDSLTWWLLVDGETEYQRIEVDNAAQLL